jgi:hypothetical protein
MLPARAGSGHSEGVNAVVLLVIGGSVEIAKAIRAADLVVAGAA